MIKEYQLSLDNYPISFNLSHIATWFKSPSNRIDPERFGTVITLPGGKVYVVKESYAKVDSDIKEALGLFETKKQ